MANEDLYGVKTKCIICTADIDDERMKRKAVTCEKPECFELLRRLRRKKTDDKSCRFCHKPSTPNARRAFTRFRKWERDNPELSHPVEWPIVAAAGMTAKDFAKALAQADRSDIELDLELRSIGWGRVRHPRDKPTPELDRALAILTAYEPPQETTDAPEEAGTTEVPTQAKGNVEGAE